MDVTKGNIRNNQSFQEMLPSIWEAVQLKVDRMIIQMGDKSPHVAPMDSGVYDNMHHDWWTSGFWPGILWIMHDMTSKKHYKEAAWRWDELIELKSIEDNNFHHDVGFQYLPTAVIKYKLTGDLDGKRRGLSAANFLAGRFNLAGNFIRAWNQDKTGWSIIDSAMNLSILFWAAEEIGDPRYSQIGIAHANSIVKHFIRQDGSVNHIVSFNPVTGEVIESLGGQGAGPDSAWSRGCAWALYGMTATYNHTGDVTYLHAAQLVAHFFIANLPNDCVSHWDFRASDHMEEEVRDTSAAACAASGLLDLAAALPSVQGRPYTDAANRILHSLTVNYSTWEHLDHEAILLYGTGSKPSNTNVNVSLIYGDYFYVEAIAKLQGWKNRIF